jgi:hypothetical protein
MVTTRAPETAVPFLGVEQTNPSGYQRARALGLLHDGAVLAAEHPEYLLYYRIVPPMDFRVAFANKDGINAVLTRLGYDVSAIREPERKAKEAGEDIRPKLNW